MAYNFKVYRSDPELSKTNERARRFAEVWRVPFIMDSRPGYHRLGNQYLIDRAMGQWDPVHRGKQIARDLSDQSLSNYARWLANFLEYSEVRCIPLVECDYRVHVQGRYQEDLKNGKWSRDGQPLKPSTVNLLVDQACAYLMWMEDKGHRPTFDVPVTMTTVGYGSGLDSHGHRTKEVAVRQGKLKKNTRPLRMPSNVQVLAWLNDVEARSGYVMRLVCETILRTAVRISEASCWRVDTLPDEPYSDVPTLWHIPNREMPESDQTVKVEIMYGTKGSRQQKELDHGDKVGPPGNIQVPLDLARKLQEYKNKLRPTALIKRVKAGATAQERKRLRDNPCVHLFLNEETGERITARQIYDAWTGAKVPFKGWSPHLGRHFWACSVLMRDFENDALIKQMGGRTPADYIKSTAVSIIQLQIMPQLRHAQSSTSMIYLEWAKRRLSRGLTIQYETDLDRSDPLECADEQAAATKESGA